MAFALDMNGAAHRHFNAAEELAVGHRRDVAGYLYGISAECAIKAMMLEAGLRPLASGPRQEDPFYAHFPRLRTLLLDSIQGRKAAPLNKLLQDVRFMSQWSTDMRYSHGRDILDAWVEAWKSQARQAIASIGT